MVTFRSCLVVAGVALLSLPVCAQSAVKASYPAAGAAQPASAAEEPPALNGWVDKPIDFTLPPASAAPVEQAGGCSEVTSAVQLSARSLTGPGHCQGETAGFFNNQFGRTVDCVWSFHHNGGWSDNGSGPVMPGQSGGEGGGVYSCGTDDSQMKYACFEHGATAANGSDCTTTVRF